MGSIAVRRFVVLVAVVALLTLSVVASAFAASGPNGPAPNSGDCISDGSGFDGAFGSGLLGAPNAGDGIPDGSGF